MSSMPHLVDALRGIASEERDVGKNEPLAAASGWIGPAVAWGSWAFLLLAALGFVAYFASDVPYRDAWELVPVLTGAEPCTAAWLWAPHNEHRIPLPKLVHLGLNCLTHASFRFGAVVNVLVLGLLAALMIRAAGQARGRTHPADAFFPLALLHWGHHETLLQSFLVQLVASTAL